MNSVNRCQPVREEAASAATNYHLQANGRVLAQPEFDFLAGLVDTGLRFVFNHCDFCSS